ncbi:MAG: rhodanese-like domain-containing protein [Lachnospiraceae bacterium]
MEIFDLTPKINMDDEIVQFYQSKDAVLLDVRTIEEYSEGHIVNSLNIPLNELSTIETHIKDKKTMIFVHCLSGGRTTKAVRVLNAIGYTNIVNAGGLNSYTGEVVT